MTIEQQRYIGTGLKPKGPNHNVLNVLTTIILDSKNLVSIRKSDYKRSAPKTYDPRVRQDPNFYNLHVTEPISSKERFNFSIAGWMIVNVAPEHGEGSFQRMVVARTLNIIRDGERLIDNFSAQLGEESYKKLHAARVIVNNDYNPYKQFLINLNDMQLISGNWARPSALQLVQLLKSERNLEDELTALNSLTKDFQPPQGNRFIFGLPVYKENKTACIYPGYTSDQQAPYKAECCTIKLMGYKSNPIDYSATTAEIAYIKAKAVRRQLNSIRFMIRAISFSMHSTESTTIKWGKDRATKYGKLEQFADYEGATLKKTTWTGEFS